MSRPTYKDNRLNPDLFVLQDSRSYESNLLRFWAKNGEGYTTDLTKAHQFSFEEADFRSQKRDTDIPHKISDIIGAQSVTIDRDQLRSYQHLRPSERLTDHEHESVETLIRQRDMLGKAIAESAINAGLCEPDAGLTGPHLMMLANDLGAAAKETVNRNMAETQQNAAQPPEASSIMDTAMDVEQDEGETDSPVQ